MSPWLLVKLYVRADLPGGYVEDNWSRLVSEALSGGHEGDWLETNN